jgi:hypothetical protein
MLNIDLLTFTDILHRRQNIRLKLVLKLISPSHLKSVRGLNLSVASSSPRLDELSHAIRSIYKLDGYMKFRCNTVLFRNSNRMLDTSSLTSLLEGRTHGRATCGIYIPMSLNVIIAHVNQKLHWHCVCAFTDQSAFYLWPAPALV